MSAPAIWEQAGLAPYACDPSQSRGRRRAEPDAPTRTAFQRDRDRVVHCSSFRRLVYKTQVFLNHEGDLFRTRLTHSLEVAQVGRSIARTLRLNEDLVEAIALAHDLGHTPFGHAGQEALNACMREHGGFEHNLQSLRVVDLLEQRYPDFDGLNLCFETREGILKHCSQAHAEAVEHDEPAHADGGGGVAVRFLRKTRPSLEAQLCNLADEIAYNAHDIDDGVRSGLLSLEQLGEVPLFAQFMAEALQAHPALHDDPQDRRLLYETIRRMLSAQIYDVIDATRKALGAVRPAHVGDVRQAQVLVGFSAPMAEQSATLKRFLFRNLYRHIQVEQTTLKARQVVAELFAAYRAAPGELQARHARRMNEAMGALGESAGMRVIADYVAGMTDRLAMREHERLTGRRLWA